MRSGFISGMLDFAHLRRLSRRLKALIALWFESL